jgi:ABC-type transport system substrate-binding protein
VKKSVLAVFLTTLIILSSIPVLSQQAHSAPTHALVLGYVAPSVPTFALSLLAGYGVGAGFDIRIPYLPINHFTQGGIGPVLAHVPYAVPGSNYTVWIYNLISPNLKWSDGVPLNSTDIYYTFDEYLPFGKYANTTSDILNGIAPNIQALQIMNSTAVQVTLNGPIPLLPHIISPLYPIYPEHYYITFGVGKHQIDSTSILGGPGSSPYVPVNYTSGATTMTFVANPYSIYWTGKTPTVPKIVMQLFADEGSMVNALAAGSVDAAAINPPDIPALQGVSWLNITSIPGLTGPYYYVNANHTYPWNNIYFRKALQTLLPKQQINQILFGGNLLYGNPMLLQPGEVPDFWPGPNTPTYNYSTTQANAYLQQAGLKLSGGKWLDPNGTAIVVPLETISSDPNYVRMGQFIQQAMQGVGLTVTIKQVDSNTIVNDWGAKDFFTLLQPWSNGPSVWRTMKNPYNTIGLTNSTFRTFVNNALHDTNLTRGKATLEKALYILADQATNNVIVWQPEIVAYNIRDYTGWQPGISQVAQLDAIENPVFAENVLTSITPVGAITSSTSSTSSTSTTTTTSTTTSSTPPTSVTSSSASGSSTIISSTTSVVTTSPTTTTSTSSTTTSSAPDYSTIILGVIALVVVLGIIGYAAIRRRPARTTTTTTKTTAT